MDGKLVYRTNLPVRIWHWFNALSVFVMLMSGMMILNAHPRLYWGKFGANPDKAWLELPKFPGYDDPFPPLVTIPSSYDLAAARQWHFFFAWVLAIGIVLFLVYALLSRHLTRDLWLKREERSFGHLWHDIKEHARLRFPTGEAARGYNPLQKIAYLGVVLVLIPLVILTGLTMSPAMNAAFPFLLDLFGGRQSARSIHFLCAAGLALFIAVHLLMVLLAGPINELRSMLTGWYRLPEEKRP
ncbi:cytochrome b/b6 domain-containing protein [Novosphingobium olei]|uniref:cytochrome b/b6 domain-containing protein n=1 Tax=Novosphingobium olei TaxID=2728851 RepID=UPI00308D90AB|nr:cytochrome b/b6 domain-containing protein [Novosphingobium olei]